jgi:TatD DNase family protein
MFFDTHCHLNFKSFKKTLPEVIARAHEAQVSRILIPGTDRKTSEQAIAIAEAYEQMYAAVGIHPHHVYDLYRKREKEHLAGQKRNESQPIPEAQNESEDIVTTELTFIESFLQNPDVVAVGEIGLDKHMYQATKYDDYIVNTAFISLQKKILRMQLALAQRYKKPVVIHNREAKDELLSTLNDVWSDEFCYNMVFHCCEPHKDLLSFALDHKIYIGVDGDVTYDQQKKDFIRTVPLKQLVIETDAPFILPEPYRSRKEYPNEPSHVGVVAETVAQITDIPVADIAQQTMENGKALFNLTC